MSLDVPKRLSYFVNKSIDSRACIIGAVFSGRAFHDKIIRRAIFAALTFVGLTSAASASWWPWQDLSASTELADRFEARFGAFAHGVGSVEKGTVSLNGELVSPRLFRTDSFWSFLVPRLHAGGFVNLSGRTNLAYAGLLWTIPIRERWFAEAFFGGAIYDGSLRGSDTMAALGCRTLFNAGASIGYRLSDQWSVMGTYNHVSNGIYAFDRDCGTNQPTGGPRFPNGRNQGLNHYGVRLGYAF